MSLAIFLESEREKNGGFVVFLEERNVMGIKGLGRELRSPQLNAASARTYEIMREPRDSDPVLIYIDEAIHSIARVRGPVDVSTTIDWQGRVDVPAYRRELTDHQQLPLPHTLDDLRSRDQEVRDVLAALKAEYGTTYSSFTYQSGGLRPTQGQYLGVLPHDVLVLFPGLQQELATYVEGTSPLDLVLAERLMTVDPALYEASENVQVRDAFAHTRAGEVMTEAINLHNSWVNRLRTMVSAKAKNSQTSDRFGLVEIPEVRGRPDLAYVVPTRGRGRRIVIVEVKTVHTANEGQQLGRAMEELARYGGAARDQWDDPIARVMFLSQRPQEGRYERWLAEMNVILCWPGRWPPGLS